MVRSCPHTECLRAARTGRISVTPVIHERASRGNTVHDEFVVEDEKYLNVVPRELRDVRAG